MKRTKYKNTFYTFTIMLLPILSIYKSPFPSVDFGTIMFFISFCYMIIKNRKLAISFPREWTIYLFYIFISIIIIYPFSIKNQDFNYILLRSIKYITYILIGIYSAYNNFFDYLFGMKIYKITAIISVLYMYIQVFFYQLFGVIVKGIFTNLLMLESYAMRFRNLIDLSRPTSIFLEPSHFFNYTMIFLIYTIFRDENYRFRDYYLAIFVSFGMILSTSGQAVLFVGGMWVLFFIKQIIGSGKKKFIFLFIFIILSPLVYFWLINSSFIQEILIRIFDQDVQGGNAVAGRAGGYILFSKLSLLGKLIGVGFGNTPNIYFNSMSFNIYSTGIIGTLFALNIYCKAYKNVKIKYLKISVISLLIVSFGNDMFMSLNAVFTFTFIYSNIYKYKYKYK